MELLRFTFATSKRAFLLAVLAGIGSGLSMVGLLALTNQVLHQPQDISLVTGGLFAAMVLAMVAFRVNSTVLLAKLSQQSIAQLRIQLCRNILRAPLSELERQGSHKLLATLSDDVATIANGIMRLPFLCINVAVVLGCLAYMLWLSWWLFLVAVAVIAFGIIAYRLPEAKALTLLTQSRLYGDQLYSGFQAVCFGTKELKMHKTRRDNFFTSHLVDATKGMQNNTVGATKYYSYSGSLGIFLFFAIIGCLIFLVPTWTNLTSATIVGYVMVFLFIQGPMEIIVNAIPELAKTGIGLKKIEQLGLKLNNSGEDSTVLEEGAAFAKNWQTLNLNQVVHSYYREREDSHFQLGPVDMQINRGEMIFLIGGNGSGKTTFAKLLLGLYEPEGGAITVDGVAVSSANREAYRQLFSAVFVDFYLFEQLMGFTDTEVDAIAQQYIDQLQLGHKVKVENGRLSTVQLSQGQKKRLALLTAYLDDRDFYLFDEWAADQDPVFKKVFYTQILPDLKAKGKTLLVISHDDQYFDIADRYIKMEAGQAILSRQRPDVLVAPADPPMAG